MITIEAKNDKFEKSGSFLFVLHLRKLGLCMAFGRILYTLLNAFNFASEPLSRGVQVVHCTTLGASFTLYDLFHRIIFQKIAVIFIF